jgi:hypothetical protein
MARVRIRNFSDGLWIAGGREDAPADAGGGPISLRKADGMNPVKTITLRSRAGSTLVRANTNAHSLIRFGGIRYAGVGTTFINADTGAVLKTGLSGNRLNFSKMPVQLGGPDYLWVLDGTMPFKMALNGTISNWGITAPPDGMTAAVGAQDVRVIDSMANPPGSSASYTLTQVIALAKKSNDTTLPNGDLELDFSGANHWRLHKALSIDLSTYADTRVSLQTDAIAITLLQSGTGFAVFGLRMRFYLDPSTVTDYYEAVVSLISQTETLTKRNLTASTFSFDWAQPMGLGEVATIEIPKSVFRRVGSNGKGWESVGQIELAPAAMSLSAADYGNTVGSNTRFGAQLFIQNWQLQGGFPLNGTYQYAETFLNSVTGSRSNSNPNYITVPNVDRQPVTLTNFAASPDPQVDEREIWRSVGVLDGGTLSNTLFLVAVIPVAQASYVDGTVADTPVPFTVNVWKAAFTVPMVGFLVDGGNGYYFKATAGTTGGTLPAWNVPNTDGFLTNYPYVVNNTIFPRHNNANKCLFKVTAVAGTKLSGATEPNWDAVGVGGSVVSGGITFTNQNVLTTTDGTVTWTLQGLNTLETLQPTQLPLDNAPIPVTTLRASSPYQGIMFSMDSANPGRLDYSAPGRPESFSGFVQVSDPDDPIQNFVIFNGNLYVWSLQRVFFVRVIGTTVEANLTLVLVDYNPVEGAPGTPYPLSIANSNQFVTYQAIEGLMKFDGATAIEFGMEALGPIFRGESAEIYVPMMIEISTYHDGEYVCSDAANQTLAIDIYTNRWRSLGVVVNALYTETDPSIAFGGNLLATLENNIVTLEDPGAIDDAGVPIALNWQTASVRLATSQQVVLQRVYIDINPNGAILTPTLILDNASISLPPLTGTGRKNPPYEWTLGLSGQMVAIELTGDVADGIIELFGVEYDVEAGVK